MVGDSQVVKELRWKAIRWWRDNGMVKNYSMHWIRWVLRVHTGMHGNLSPCWIPNSTMQYCIIHLKTLSTTLRVPKLRTAFDGNMRILHGLHWTVPLCMAWFGPTIFICYMKKSLFRNLLSLSVVKMSPNLLPYKLVFPSLELALLAYTNIRHFDLINAHRDSTLIKCSHISMRLGDASLAWESYLITNKVNPPNLTSASNVI